MKIPKISSLWITWAAGILAIGLASYVYSLFTGRQPNIPVPPAPPEPIFVGAMGWHNDPAEVEKAIKAIEAAQGFRARFAIAGARLLEAPTDDSVFLWDAETKILGKLLPSWDQGQVGCCVSFGWGRGVQDLLLLQVAAGAAEEWPGHQVATEEIYGGSRVQIGHNQLGREDGSTGAWAGQFVHEYGVLLRQPYPGGVNLSTYSESLTRQWGNSGVPAELLPECHKHAVRGIAQIGNSDEAWAALGNGYPIPICSDVGFASPLRTHLPELFKSSPPLRGGLRVASRRVPPRSGGLLWANYSTGVCPR